MKLRDCHYELATRLEKDFGLVLVMDTFVKNTPRGIEGGGASLYCMVRRRNAGTYMEQLDLFRPVAQYLKKWDRVKIGRVYSFDNLVIGIYGEDFGNMTQFTFIPRLK